MALTACLGMGDEEIMELLPGKTDASKALIVGLRSWDEGMQERQRKLGIKGLSPQEVANDRTKIMEWLKNTGGGYTFRYGCIGPGRDNRCRRR